MITNDLLINDLLKLRDAIVHAGRGVVTDTIFMRDSSCQTVVEKIEMMILDKIDIVADRKMMETFFELDV